MIKTSSNSVYDSETTRGMVFKLMNAVIDGSKESGEDSYFFEDGQIEKDKIGHFKIKDVKGNDEDVDFYIRPKSARPSSSAYMLTKRENNGKMAIVFMIEDQMTFGDFMKKIQEEEYFTDIYSSIGHEVTHLREAEAKQKAYGQESSDKMEALLMGEDRDAYSKEYVNSEVEFEAIIATTISSTESELISIVSFGANEQQVREVLNKTYSGGMEKSLVKHFMKMFKAMADKFEWSDKKRRKAYSKIVSAARSIVLNVRDHILKHVIKSKK